jgi:tRNA (mo5U34)-methyltransferase
MQVTAGDIQGSVDAVALWYHTIDLPGGIATPGWFDLRPVVERMPWPDVRGKRCLDVGTYDGFLAFELERRGASEVLAADIADHASWDWPARARALGPDRLATMAGPEKGEGFRVAKAALGSAVERVEVSAYDLDPAQLGTFDVVVCGSLMLHLRDPVRALEAIRGVCRGHFLSAETIVADLALRFRRRAVVDFLGDDQLCQWWLPSPAAHRRIVQAAGFRIERHTRPYAIPFGPAHPPRAGRSASELRRRAAMRLAAGGDGVPHAAVLAVPEI